MFAKTFLLALRKMRPFRMVLPKTRTFVRASLSRRKATVESTAMGCGQRANRAPRTSRTVHLPDLLALPQPERLSQRAVVQGNRFRMLPYEMMECESEAAMVGAGAVEAVAAVAAVAVADEA